MASPFPVVGYSVPQREAESPHGSADGRLYDAGLKLQQQRHRRLLNQVVDFQVDEQDVVLHGSEDKSNVVRVRGAGEVGVNHFLHVWIETHKHVQDEVFYRLDVLLGTWWEAAEGRSSA